MVVYLRIWLLVDMINILTYCYSALFLVIQLVEIELNLALINNKLRFQRAVH